MSKLILYDISSPLQPRSYAPNPSKARLALSFKGVEFESRWVDLLDLENVRRGLNCPATRKLDDGSDFYTLPILQTPDSKIIGDSFDIAIYLADNFSDDITKSLFPYRNGKEDSKAKWESYESPAKDTLFFAPITTNHGSKYPSYAKFNLHVDATFSSAMIGYGQYLPFNPDSAEEVKRVMAKRAHLNSWDDLAILGEARKSLKEPFMNTLESLAECFESYHHRRGHASGEEQANENVGVYLEGDHPSYADLILGGWLNMLSCIMPKDEWEDFRTWHGGVFARLHDELQKKYFVCT